MAMASPLIRQTIMHLKPTTLKLSRPLSLSSSSDDADPNDVVSSAASILINYRSKARWGTLLAHYPQGFTPHQVSLILLRIRSNPNLCCAFFRFTTQNALTCHDLHSYSTFIHILSRVHKKSRAQSAIRTAICSFDDPDPPHLAFFRALVETYTSSDSSPLVFDLLILTYLESSRIDLCLHIVRLLQPGGFKLELKTCNALVSRVATHRGVGLAFDLYRDLFGALDDDGSGTGMGKKNLRPNAATFNKMLMVCYREGLLDKAEEIWKEMRRLNCDPNPPTYHIMMAAYCKEGEMEKAHQLWEEMKTKGLKHGDVVAYNTLIGGWCNIGKIQTGEELYREMEAAGIEATIVTYQHLINGNCKAGDISSGYLLFKEMCGKGFVPDVSTVDLLVRELCKERMVSQALQVFKHVMKDANFGAQRSSYEFLIKGLCANGEMEEALKVQAEMVGKGFEPNHDVYVAFVDGYNKLGKSDMAERLIREEMNQKLILKGD